MISPARLLETVAGGLALVLPVVQSRSALVLMVVGLLALVDVAIRSTAAARTIVACAVVGNGFVFAHPQTSTSAALLWADAVLLLLFLALGGWGEAGARDLNDAVRAVLRISGTRIGAGAVVIAAVTAASWLTVSPNIWFVFAAMVSGIAVLALAVKHSS